MLIKKIKLHNFRQISEDTIDFAEGKDGKNVTIIIGDNGTGKTTLAQAFIWCLYGETDFQDKILLNRIVAERMTPSDKETVEVVLTILHGNTEYEVNRKQTYRKDYSNSIKPDPSLVNIQKKNSDGNTEWVKGSDCESTINSILPKELSRYFFFDGERIQNMSKEITGGKRSSDFKDAVNGLLGLNAIQKTIEHFNPKRQNGVIRSFEPNDNSNEKLQTLGEQIKDYQKQLDRIDGQIDNLEEEISTAENTKELKSEEIKKYKDAKQLQEKKESFEDKIKDDERGRLTVLKSISKSFNNDSNSFFSINMIERAMNMIKDTDLIGTDIPHIHADTCEFLLNRGECLCGTKLIKGSNSYKKVSSLMEYVPPKSIGNVISDFKHIAHTRAGYEENLKDEIAVQMEDVSDYSDQISDSNEKIYRIDDKLKGDDVSSKVQVLSQQIVFCERTINEDSSHKEDLLVKKGSIATNLSRIESERNTLSLLDEKNRSIIICKSYAERIYEELDSEYKIHETEVRERLQKTINDIFKQIFDGELSLTIDDKYHISVYAEDHEGDVETSTAQSISVIFAFITGIIKMAKENQTASDDETKQLSSEPYPLVMDAPLSAFDKRRIKNVCETLPKIAEQVIIFSFDTDGEVAEEYIGAKIGKRHKFNKINEFETHLIGE